MNRRAPKNPQGNLVFWAGLAGVGCMAGVLLLASRSLWPALLGAAVFWIAGYGTGYVKPRSTTSGACPASGDPPQAMEPEPSGWTAEDGFWLGLIRELGQMQSRQDLLERYRSFGTLVETVLVRALGPCNITLWCPDNHWDYLVECVIRPSGPEKTADHQLLSAAEKQPCRVRLDSRIIEYVLRTGKPYLFCDPSAARLMIRYAREGSLRSEACLGLNRRYGQPLIINVNGLAEPRRIKPDEFYLAADLITLFWHQLQATNQRQWSMEHDPSSRALRDENFLEQTQQRTAQARQKGECFAMAVLTLHGFRGMFAGHSQRWRELNAVIGQKVHEVLSGFKPEVLLGKMADDVFALYLPHTDEFLARATMQKVMQILRQQLPENAVLQHLELMGIEMRWAVSDQNDYAGDVNDWLNHIYRGLFIQRGRDHDGVCRVELNPLASGVS